MPDSNPNSLTQKPTFNIMKYGKKPLYVALVIGALLLVVLIVSVHLSTKKAEEAKAQNQAVSITESAASFLPTEAPLGVAHASVAKPQESVELAQSPTEIHIHSGGNDQPSEEWLARKRELEEIRQYKRKSEFQALTSSMEIAVPTSHSQSVQNAAPPQSGQIGTATSGMSAMAPPTPQTQSAEYDQAERIDKEGFYERADRSQWQLAHRRVQGSPYELKTGSVIPCLMISGIDSDLPGPISGQVSQDIYDTATGNFKIIPRGSRVHGLYDSRIVAGQERVLVAWNRIVFPDGSSITLGAMHGADMGGYAGFHGEVDNHYWKVFSQAALMSFISGGAAYAMDSTTSGDRNNDNPSVLNSFGGALASQMNQATSTLLQRNASIKPSLGINPGYRFNIVVTKDMVFANPYEPWR